MSASTDYTATPSAVPIAFCGRTSEQDRKVLLRPFWVHGIFVYLLAGVLWLSSFGVLSTLQLIGHRVFFGLIIVFMVGLAWRHVVRMKRRKRLEELRLPETDVDATRFTVIGDPRVWEWPSEIAVTPFETREFPALASRILKKHPFLFPAIPFYSMLCLEELMDGSIMTWFVVAIMTHLIVTKFLDPTRYEIIPGRLNIRSATHFGKKDKIDESIDISGWTCVADFDDGIVYLVRDDETKTIPLLGIKEKQAFVYYLMLASRLRSD